MPTTTLTPTDAAGDQSRALTAHDRCDRCGAAARTLLGVRVSDGRTLPLAFCGHHGNAHMPRVHPALIGWVNTQFARGVR